MSGRTDEKVGFGVRCPYCKTEDCTVYMDLNDLDRVICGSCAEEFSPRMAAEGPATEQARAAWQGVEDWIDAAPSFVEK